MGIISLETQNFSHELSLQKGNASLVSNTGELLRSAPRTANGSKLAEQEAESRSSPARPFYSVKREATVAFLEKINGYPNADDLCVLDQIGIKIIPHVVCIIGGHNMAIDGNWADGVGMSAVKRFGFNDPLNQKGEAFLLLKTAQFLGSKGITATANGSKLAEQEAELSHSSPARYYSLNADDVPEKIKISPNAYDLCVLDPTGLKIISQLDSGGGDHNMATDGYGGGVEAFAFKRSGFYYPTPRVLSVSPDIHSDTPKKEYSCIDIHEEGILNMEWDDSARNYYVKSVQEKQLRLKMVGLGPVVEYMERAVGSLFTSSYANFPAPSWVTTIVEIAKIVGFASAAAGYGTGDYSDKLSRILIKGGAIATGTAVIASLAMPLPPAVAWTVGPVACLAVAAAVVSN